MFFTRLTQFIFFLAKPGAFHKDNGKFRGAPTDLLALAMVMVTNNLSITTKSESVQYFKEIFTILVLVFRRENVTMS